MTMNTQQSGVTDSTSIPIGAKLQSAREAQRIDRKDAAAKLRLNESVIDMMENDSFPTTMPSIFVRGYIRAYGKLLELPEDIISAGLEPIKPQNGAQEATISSTTLVEPTHKRLQYLMKGITTAIFLTLLGLVAAWWLNHKSTPQPENIALTVPSEKTTITEAIQQAPAGITILPPQSPASSVLSTNTSPNDTSSLHAVSPTSIVPEKLAAMTTTAANTVQPTPSAPPAAKAVEDISIPAYKRAAMAANTVVE